MLLVELTIDDILYRVSNDFHKLTHFWDAKVSSMSDVKYSMATNYGGYVKPSYGSISLVPDLFTGLPYYPVTGEIKVSHTESDEESAVLIFEGTVYLEEISRKEIVYGLYGDDIEDKVTDKTYSGTLVDVFSSSCDALEVTLVLDSSNARDPSPAISYTTSGEGLVLDNLSDMAKFSKHMFYIKGGTLYLVDLDISTEVIPITEFDIFPSKYTYDPPISLFTTGYEDTEATVDGTYTFNENEVSISPQCNTSVTESESALELIKETLEKPSVELSLPLNYIYPVGSKLTLTDESQEITLNVVANVRSIVYNFDSDRCIITGDGEFV